MSFLPVLFDPGQKGVALRTALRSAPIIARGFKSSPQRLPPTAASMVASIDRSRQGKANVQLFRNWAEHSEWVRVAINIRKGQISQAEWKIQPVDPEKPWSQSLADRITEVISKPCPRNPTFRDFIEPIVEDILVLDAGCFEKEFSLRDEPVRLHPVDGGEIRISTRWDGDPEEARYFWYPKGAIREEASWLDREFAYMMMNPSTYRVVGLSPLETLKMAIDSELGGSTYNDRQMRQAAPDGMLDLGENARPDQVEDFRRFWASEIAGRGAMAIVGGTRGSKWVTFRPTNRDAQFMEWQMYLVRKIAGVFQLSPQDFGIDFATASRATSEVQQENTEDRGLRPLLGRVQDTITREVVQDSGYGGPENNLAFAFTLLNLKESLARAQINRYALGGIGWKVVDEARRDDGRPPLGGQLGQGLIVMGPKGPVLLTEGDIPTAREALEAGASQPRPPSGGSPGSTKETEPVLVGAGDWKENSEWPLP